MEKYYVYSWWSGSHIEQQESRIINIVDDTIYFYNNYCEENQEVNIKNCKPEFIKDGYYINKEVA
tara:strand:- start:290 stop:484 length:195 start_codon:yes stop_codon:yes gene_type:complete